ncbi:DNA-directed RNA polymerase subunit omega [Marinifilum caeruleilacunae]|jgi:DNA-directed RNA polymerase subunit K/omega|uniref:DNA-directed RNA polymerase subunit omega n=1 Tax=Marinifilum caeruleilacunae TaxID=2499076 RepID=A0ABX1WZE7_9BACT|nr:DNA-directed RNA polymerase subunit omega [Marinifilum caeruleilacunae]MCT4604450.1 DNA-directed RNA polymerase subunit omega [Marinifilum sp.]NOU61497.1 RNA polymerase Rpb6 [Marinifilum caeruleilacunae]
MDYKKTNAASSTVTRNMNEMSKEVGNVYESVMIMAKRSNQIAVELKSELNKKLQEFASYTDNLEEVFENREQIEISKYYERLPKPTLIAVEEFINGEIYYRNPSKEQKSED